MANEVGLLKTYDPEVDDLIAKLTSPWDGGPSAGYAMVIDEDVAQRAADMIYKLYDQLQTYEAEHYNQQIGG